MIKKYNIDIPIDSIERTVFHREIIVNKKFMRRLYEDWYSQFFKNTKKNLDGLKVEIGSGGGFLKEIDKTIICTDIIEVPGLDMYFSALEMPFKDHSVSSLYMIDVFHHIPDSKKFLEETNRILQKNGRMIMVEPANSFWGRFINQNFHSEPFEPDGDWTIKGTGPLSSANGALPWIVFERDEKKFQELFPDLEIVQIKYHTPLRYLLSGGLQFASFVPLWSFPFFTMTDKILSMISKQFSMFVTIVIEKKK